MRPALLLLALAACGSSSSESNRTCVIDVALEPTAVVAGDEVTASGGPFSEVYDTRVLVGGVDADVLAVVREDCLSCDLCREEENCQSCGTCEPCESVCTPCTQTLRFTVPVTPAGERPVLIFNRHGGSQLGALDVSAAPGDSATP